MRAALYPAVFGTLGVMLAWLLWVAMHAFEEDPVRVLLAPAIGAAVGFAVDFLKRLLRVSRREAREGPSPKPAIPAEHRERIREEPDYIGSTTAIALCIAFLGSVCTNLVGDMMNRLLSPFLATLAIFFPVGLWFGFVFHPDRDPLGLLGAVARGLLAGAGAGAIAIAMSALLDLGIDSDMLLGFLGWWGLLGLGWGLALGLEGRLRPFAPLLGTVVASVLLTVSTSTLAGGGVVALVRPLSDELAAQALKYPGLPAKFWDRAVDEFKKGHAEPEQVREAPETPGESPTPAPLLTRKPPVTAAPDKPQPMPAGPMRDLLVAAGAKEHQRRASESALERSWLVLVLFSLSFGYGQWLEQRFLPREYERSDTRRNDRLLGIAAALLWIVASAKFAFGGWT